MLVVKSVLEIIANCGFQTCNVSPEIALRKFSWEFLKLLSSLSEQFFHVKEHIAGNSYTCTSSYIFIMKNVILLIPICSVPSLLKPTISYPFRSERTLCIS